MPFALLQVVRPTYLPPHAGHSVRPESRHGRNDALTPEFLVRARSRRTFATASATSSLTISAIAPGFLIQFSSSFFTGRRLIGRKATNDGAGELRRDAISMR